MSDGVFTEEPDRQDLGQQSVLIVDFYVREIAGERSISFGEADAYDIDSWISAELSSLAIPLQRHVLPTVREQVDPAEHEPGTVVARLNCGKDDPSLSLLV